MSAVYDEPVATHAITTREYLRMVDLGALEGVPVELLDGRLVDVSPQSPQHSAAIQALNVWFAPRVADVVLQAPLVAAEGWVPEPDVAIVGRLDGRRHPDAAELVVEVVVSRRVEAEQKLPGYAMAGIPLVWLIDLPRRAVVVHERPVDGRYEHVRTLRGEDVLAPPGLPERTVAQVLAAAGVGGS